jgi:hypothetical protein
MNRELPVLIEAGHYYESYGPTIWSRLGVQLTDSIDHPKKKKMLLIDDVHALDQVSQHEATQPVISLEFEPDYVILESAMFPKAENLLGILTSLPKSMRATKNNKDGKWYISGFPITDRNGKPICVLLDAALSVTKYEMGFNQTVTMLPNFYAVEQRNLMRILGKIMPRDFQTKTILFDMNGKETANIELRQQSAMV